MKIENCEPNVGYAGMATAKEPDGAFTDIRRATDQLYVALSMVERLAGNMVGEEGTESQTMTEKYRCGGKLGELSQTACSIQEAASRIIENIERIERHAD